LRPKLERRSLGEI